MVGEMRAARWPPACKAPRGTPWLREANDGKSASLEASCPADDVIVQRNTEAMRRDRTRAGLERRYRVSEDPG